MVQTMRARLDGLRPDVTRRTAASPREETIVTSTADNASHQIPPGWVGGFAQSNPALAYPDPDMSSVPMLDNMANIDKLQRQWPIQWPEFSWETIPGDPDSRCYQMFAPFISRIGYDDAGRIYSIICQQQGVATALGSINVEITVTGQRGWVDEESGALAGDMTVMAKVWFGPSANENKVVKRIWDEFSKRNYQFPSDKANAIEANTFDPGNPSQPIFPIRKGQSPEADFPVPDFAKHPDAWGAVNLGVEIGDIKKTGEPAVDEFNTVVMDLFNLHSGNILKAGNTLTWNVWCLPPELVNQQEWREHAEKWRDSIDADHGTPDGPGTRPKFYDGKKFDPVKEDIEHEAKKILDYIHKHL